jgi:cell division septum initiation protein DivIVA
MQPDTNAQRSNSSDGVPQPDFGRVLRGFDSHQVNEYLKQLNAELRHRAEQEQAVRSELAEAQRKIQEQQRSAAPRLGTRIDRQLQLAEEQRNEILQEAKSAAKDFTAKARAESARVSEAAQKEAAELRVNAKRETEELRSSAARETEVMRTSARREADELSVTTKRKVAELRATAERAVADKRAAAQEDLVKLRHSTEHEFVQLKESSKQEWEEILAAARREAAEMRSEAQQLLEKSKARQSKAGAEFDTRFTSRREEAERREAERLAAAKAVTDKLVSAAELRAGAAKQRIAAASATAEEIRQDADQHASRLMAKAKEEADQIIGQAEAHAAKLLAATRSAAERERAIAQRFVDELNEQKEGVAADLALISELLGAQMPRLSAALKRAPAGRAGRSRQQVRAPLGALRGPAPAGPEVADESLGSREDAPTAADRTQAGG